MLRGYRLLGFAALAAALLIAFGLGAYWMGLPHPQERYQSYQQSNANEGGALDTVSNVPTPIVERTPCQNPKSETESDLCAQWRAAKAAEKSADWTLYGVIASAIGISLLLWQIMLTREAVKDTGDATIAMQQANEIARQQKSSELIITNVKIRIRRTFSVQVFAQNIGDVTAKGIRISVTPRVTIKVPIPGVIPFTVRMAQFQPMESEGTIIHFGKESRILESGTNLDDAVMSLKQIMDAIPLSQGLLITLTGRMEWTSANSIQHSIGFFAHLSGGNITVDGFVTADNPEVHYYEWVDEKA